MVSPCNSTIWVAIINQNCSSNAVASPDDYGINGDGGGEVCFAQFHRPLHTATSFCGCSDREAGNVQQLYQRQPHHIAQFDVLSQFLTARGVHSTSVELGITANTRQHIQAVLFVDRALLCKKAYRPAIQTREANNHRPAPESPNFKERILVHNPCNDGSDIIGTLAPSWDSLPQLRARTVGVIY